MLAAGHDGRDPALRPPVVCLRRRRLGYAFLAAEVVVLVLRREEVVDQCR